MKFPLISRRRHDASLQKEKTRVHKAKKRAESAKKAAKQHRKEIALLRQQLSGGGDLRKVFAKKLSGEGIEIGALHRPLPVPPGVTVKYVDILTREQNMANYPELAADIVETTFICDGQTLSTVPDKSQDFVIANHMLEHCVNPLMALENFLRVLRDGGRMFISLPDKRFTFDFKRPVTPWSHVLNDYRIGRTVEERSVMEEYKELVDPSFNVDAALKNGQNIHHHVWTQAEILELFIELRRTLGWPVEVELCGRQGGEVVLVLQKDDPVPGDQAKTAPKVALAG